MLRRYLDTLAQYFRVVLVAAVLIPSLLVAGNVALDGGELVTARIWIPGPVFLLDARVSGRAAGGAAMQARLLQELVSTDAFTDEVLSGAWVGVGGAVSSEQRRRLRSRLQILAEGEQLLSVSYRSEHASEGVSMLNSLIKAYGISTVVIQLDNAQHRSPSSTVDLRAARATVDRYFSSQGAARRSAGSAGTARPAPESPQALLATVGAMADQYRRQLAGRLPLAAGREDLSQLQPAAFQLVDPPAIEHRSPVRLVALFAEGLLAVVAGALLVAYVLVASRRAASSPPRMHPMKTATRKAERPRS